MISTEILPISAIALPLITGLSHMLFGTHVPNKAKGSVTTIASTITFFITVYMLPTVWQEGIIVYNLAGWMPPIGITLVVDALNALIAVILTGIILLTSLYSIRYMELDKGLQYYYALLMFLLTGMLGVVLTGDLFNLFVFIEIASISAYGLVAFRRDHYEPLEAGFKYAVIGTVATSFILFSIGLLYGVTGTLNMADMAQKLRLHEYLQGVPKDTLAVPMATMILVWGFGVKAGMAPMHTWLPDAHPAAPSPVSAVLSGVLIKVGIYAIARLLFTIYGVVDYGWILPYLATFGMVTMLVGGLALVQADVKRLLAFSSILNIGYILLGLGFGTPLGLTGSLLHLLNHAITKSLLFFAIGAVIYRTGHRYTIELGGLAYRMPVTAICFAIGSLAIAGVPPLNGFFSKWIIFKAGIETGQPLYMVYVILGIVMSVITVAFMLRAFQSVFLGELRPAFKDVNEVPKIMLIPMLVLTFFVIVLGVFLQDFLNMIAPAVGALLDQGSYLNGVMQ